MPALEASHQQPHLVSLVLQSKKALQHGEQLCSKAHALSSASLQSSVDIFALDAKVRWLSGAIVEQLKMASSVAKCIEEKRSNLRRQVESWDILRAKHTSALDSILDALGSQIVPSEFHESSDDSSLFGSQFSDEESESKFSGSKVKINGHSTISGGKNSLLLSKKRSRDRSRWKTLRDFVDDRAIEDALETMDTDRTALDELLGQTDEYPETLKGTVEAIRNSIPPDVFSSTDNAGPVSVIQPCLSAQDAMKASMAIRLEDLARHYDQMANALRETERGLDTDIFSEEDITEMNRDTEELPAIIGELEESMAIIELNHNKLQTFLNSLKKSLEDLSGVLDDLDEFAEIMTEMLYTQETVETKCDEGLNGLHQHLVVLEQLHDRYVSYQTAYNKLVLEMARRRHYCEAVERIVRGMAKQLEEMTMDESRVRGLFNSEYGGHLPEDICLYIENTPTKWQVIPWEGDKLELLPEVPDDLIVEARDKVGFADNPGTDSL
ncbi:autophagy-related protein 17 [Amanita rubescens]|nr:autophagy-related protein 17 [Amanita rubescens]